MGILVLVLLVAAWGLVLGPALLRTTQEPSPLRTEKMFRRALSALGGPRRPRGDAPGGRWVLVPPSSDYPRKRMMAGGPAPGGPRKGMSAADRRRRNLTFLAGFIIVTFLLGLIPALKFLLVVNVIADVLLITYLVAAIVFAARPVPPQRARVESFPDVSPPEAAGGGL